MQTMNQESQGSSLEPSEGSSQDPTYTPESLTESPDQLGAFLLGKSQRAYRLSSKLISDIDSCQPDETTDRQQSFDDTENKSEGSSRSRDICPRCEPILVQAAVSFHTIKHQSSTLMKRMKCHPDPKKVDVRQWRNVRDENTWIRANMFDPAGNLLFCQQCILSALEIHWHRLQRQREIKRQEFLNPIVTLRKKDVEKENLHEWVIMPYDDDDKNFDTWWSTVDGNDEVDVRQFASRHGLQGKSSNHKKSDLQEQFLAFVDANKVPTGRHSEGSGSLYYFLPQYTRISIPKKSENNYEEKMTQSLVAVFNMQQTELDRATVGCTTAERWLHDERPRHSIILINQIIAIPVRNLVSRSQLRKQHCSG
ncbi:uncharacterized protein [Ptychodera flava]|uniref:uncharacterized protein n=1 Tax=Ptychodera flava TaxID=63121 RepID=UPI003969D8AE